MRWLVTYLRQCFCKHDWELIHDVYVDGESSAYRCKTYRCKKCGYSMKYKSH